MLGQFQLDYLIVDHLGLNLKVITFNFDEVHDFQVFLALRTLIPFLLEAVFDFDYLQVVYVWSWVVANAPGVEIEHFFECVGGEGQSRDVLQFVDWLVLMRFVLLLELLLERAVHALRWRDCNVDAWFAVILLESVEQFLKQVRNVFLAAVVIFNFELDNHFREQIV